MKKIGLTLFAWICTTMFAFAQSNTQAHKLPEDFLNFFVGSWTGEGAFASGKKISADLVFKLSLDSSWISYEHTDKAPNTYKSFSMWGIDRQSGQFLAYAFDNFSGHRKFVSDGWKDGKLLLSTNEFVPQRGVMFQHFIYEKLSDRSFKMTYEVSKDGISWRMVDYLVFNKV